MGRRELRLRRCGPTGPVTPRIVQGSWESRRYPGSPTFAAHCEQLARAFPRSREGTGKELIAAMWCVVEERTSMLELLHPHRHRVVGLLVRLGSMSGAWVRSPDTFHPRATCPRTQTSELVAHLFARYDAPAFFERAWWPDRPVWKRDWPAFQWYVHVASGGSLRTAPRLPTTLTRRAAHEAAQAPSTLTPRQALRWGQLRASGVPETIAAEVLRTPIGTDFTHDAFWLLFFSKLASQTDLRREQVGPLIDYVRHMRFVAPNGEQFSLGRRSVPSLLRAMDRWHQELGDQRLALAHLGVTQLSDATWAPLQGVEPIEDDDWDLQELCSMRALFLEGRRMHHCVATYAHSCLRGQTSIWTLTRQGDESAANRVTIRIDKAARVIVEARSLANGPVSGSAFRLIRSWANHNHLQIDHVMVA